MGWSGDPAHHVCLRISLKARQQFAVEGRGKINRHWAESHSLKLNRTCKHYVNCQQDLSATPSEFFNCRTILFNYFIYKYVLFHEALAMCTVAVEHSCLPRTTAAAVVGRGSVNWDMQFKDDSPG